MQTDLNILFWGLGIFLISVIGLAWLRSRMRWTRIEKVNQKVGITRQNAYLDRRGYLRWKSNEKLCHRDIAYRHLNHRRIPFSECDVHHRNGNKLDDNPENLQILTREEHKIAHKEMRLK